MHDWPAAERAAWARATDARDFFDDQAVAAGWRPKTRKQARSAYSRWLAYLARTWPDELTKPIAARDMPSLIEAYCRELSSRVQPMSIAAELQHLLLALRALEPGEPWKWLARLQYRWQRRAVPTDRRSQIVDPRVLWALGRQLMDSADTAGECLDQARQYRDGLIIALLTFVPLRRRSLTALRLGQHVRRVGDGYVVELDADDTKAGHPVSFEVPPVLVPYLERYVTEYWTYFPAVASETALWRSSKGGGLGAEAIYEVVCRRTKAALGFAVHPHLFRAIAATAIAREAPEDIAIARDLLTQARLQTTAQYYIRSQSVIATHQYRTILDRHREQRSARDTVSDTLPTVCSTNTERR